LAGAAPAAETNQNAQWLPLGVFGLMPTGQKSPQMVFQLAVDKNGVIRGNYYDPATKTNEAVEGAVDKKNQRVAWHVAGNKDMVIETGLYNLTQDESTALIHLGPDRTQQDLMVRMKQPEAHGQQPAATPAK
jgi:hypothetical protein